MISFFYGFPLGYLTAKIFAGYKAGEDGVIKSIVFTVGDYCIHVHHWIMGASALLFYLNYLMIYREAFSALSLPLIGFFTGIALQGIMEYKDWKLIIKKI